MKRCNLCGHKWERHIREERTLDMVYVCVGESLPCDCIRGYSKDGLGLQLQD